MSHFKMELGVKFFSKCLQIIVLLIAEMPNNICVIDHLSGSFLCSSLTNLRHVHFLCFVNDKNTFLSEINIFNV